jgi:hypothetical protein
MFPFYAVMIKRPGLIFGILFIGFTTLFSIITNHDLSLAEHIGKSMFMGIVMTGFMNRWVDDIRNVVRHGHTAN